jgi:glutathione S-transferase/putative glutathione S-transferase
VPALWDRETHRIVSNNFPDITIDLGTQFGAWAAPSSPDLYPGPLRAEIDALNERVYTRVNNGPYRVAGATTEADYAELRRSMIAMLEELDERLAGRRYLFGGEVTEADVRLWPTLARFDAGYNPMAGVSERRLTEFGNLWAYARDLYRLPAFRDTTDFSSYRGLARGPKPTFLNAAPWRIQIEPRLADWDAPPARGHLG